MAQRKDVEVAWLDEQMPKYTRKIWEKTGLKVKDPLGGLGCGAFGCVYLTDDPRWVVKVTGDRDEGPMCQKIIELRAEADGSSGLGPSTTLPGVVFFRDIFRARQIEHHRHIFRPYVIVRENVRPLEFEDIEPWNWYIDKSIDITLGDEKNLDKEPHPSIDILMYWLRSFAVVHKKSEGLERRWNKVLHWLKVAAKDAPLVASTMAELIQQTIVPQDVHVYNLGYSTVNWGSRYRQKNSIVIYDLGMTPTSPMNAPKMLNPIVVD